MARKIKQASLPNGGRPGRKKLDPPSNGEIIDLPDLLEKVYRRIDAALDREDLTLADLVHLGRVISYLKGQGTRPPPLRKGSGPILDSVLEE